MTDKEVMTPIQLMRTIAGLTTDWTGDDYEAVAMIMTELISYREKAKVLQAEIHFLRNLASDNADE